MSKKKYVIEIRNVTLLVHVESESKEGAEKLALEDWRDMDIITDGCDIVVEEDLDE